MDTNAALAVLLVEDSETDTKLMVHTLRRSGYAPRWQRVQTSRALREALSSNQAVELTPRQREIVKLIAQGESTKQIAIGLKISVKTVESHRAQIMERLRIHTVAGLVHYAIRRRIVRHEE